MIISACATCLQLQDLHFPKLLVSLNGLLRPDQNICKLNLTIKGQILTTPEKVADAFIEYFSNVANLSDDVIPSTKSSLLQHTNRTSNSLHFLR